MPPRPPAQLLHAARAPGPAGGSCSTLRPIAPFGARWIPLCSARRHASSSSSSSSRSGPSLPRRMLSATVLLSSCGLAYLYYTDSRSMAHERLAMPVIRYFFDAETSHRMAVRLLAWPKWARPRDHGEDGEELGTELFGMPLVNPVGIAAGFDKNGDAIEGLFDLGFGYVEIGSVTPEPQPGNPQPRFFRLEEDQAAINRYGFNSMGHGHALGRLRARLVAFSRSHPEHFPSPLPRNPSPPTDLPRSLRPGHILAVNLGKNKTSPADSNDDYVRGVRTLGPYADVVVVNVSSPNTPGLRALQGREILARLLGEVVDEREKIKDARGLPKIAVKVACDLTEEELVDVAYAVRKSGVDGVIMSNTTVRREGLGLESPHQKEIGGLSGRPLFPLALSAVRTLRPLLPPSIPIIGAGGVSSAPDALAMAHAGASLVQLYTSFGYQGVGTARLLKDALSAALVHGQSKSNWAGEVGRDWRGAGQEEDWSLGRLERESEALRSEAEELARMLRQMQEEGAGLRGAGSEADALDGQASAAAEEAGPRDGLLGAAPAGGDEVPATGRITSGGGGPVGRLGAPTQDQAEDVARDLEGGGLGEAGPGVLHVEEHERADDSDRRSSDGPRRLL